MKSEETQSQALCLHGSLIRRADCAHCTIRDKMLFADLDIQAIAPQLESISNIVYQSGDIIYHQGDEPSAIYSLRRGIVKLSLVSAEGEARIVRLLGPGAVIGLEVQQSLAYHHTAEPLSYADVCRIPLGALNQIAVKQPDLNKALINRWNEHIEIADRHLLSLSTGVIKNRVLRLLALLDELCKRSGNQLHIPINRDCADILGAREESVSRIMAELKRADVLQRQGNGEWLLSPPLDSSVA